MKFKKIQDNTIENILQKYQPSKEILALVTPQMAPDEFLQLVVNKKLFSDAVAFLAHALPLRESIYWAFLTISFLQHKFKDPTSHKILVTVQSWFQNPDEQNRYLCGELAESLKLDTGPAWLAEAVFWSGGSILPPKDPVTLPAPYLYAKAVAGAINLGICLEEDMNKLDEKILHKNYQNALKIAFNIAQGGDGNVLG